MVYIELHTLIRALYCPPCVRFLDREKYLRTIACWTKMVVVRSRGWIK